MDATTLLQCFSDTLSHEAAVRTDAESKLKEFSKVLGFLGACLDILSSTEVPGHLKLSAALYFKNKVTYGWSGKSICRNELLDYTIDNDEKPVVKEMLIKALVNCSSNAPKCIRVLQPALTEIITVEYGSGKWDSLLVESFQSLNSSDIHTAHIGLLCAAEVFRTYRWKDNDDRQNLEMIIVEYFPGLLEYAEQRLLMDGANLDNELIGQMVKLVLKIYKFVTYNDLPFTLQRPESFIPWAKFHVAIIQQQLSSNFLSSTTKDERKKNAWVKAKKWAYANMHRLFQRYASESLSKKFSYDGFKGLYIEEFLPQLLQLLFQQIEQWGSGALWLSEESMYYILEFIEQTVTQKATWPIVNRHYATILQHVIFPLLCPNEETLEVFESDPQEYIHRNLESWDENYSPDLAALSLLTTAIRKRTKTTLEPTLQFVTQCLQQNAVNGKEMTLEQATKTESCLRIVSSILEKLIHPKSPYSAEMEGFMSAFVFPMFQSDYGFLRARACELCSKLHGYKFSQTYNLQVIYNGVMECFNNDNNPLPVRLLAALALQTFIDVPEFNQSLKEIVVPTMQRLLQLSNEFESDTISGVMQEFVESFPEQLQPFAVELMNNLVQQFLKLAIDFHEASNFNINSLNVGELPDESDKQLAALGILSTAISILLSFENSKDIAKNLEQSFYPAAEFILKNDIEDFYRDACEFVENSTFLLREVTPISWKILELIGECNERENSMTSFYLEDFMLAINNYLIYGRNELRQNSFYLRILFRIFQKASESEDNGLDEVKVLSDLSQKIVLALGDTTPRSYLDVFLTNAVDAIKTEQHILKQQVSFGVTVFNVVVSSLLYFPLETLQFLQTNNCLQIFFEVWIGHYIPNCKRIYDIKLYLMTLLSLSSNTSMNDLVSIGLEPVVSKMGELIYNLIERYPVALMKLKDKRNVFSSDAFGSSEAFDDYEEDSYNDADGELNEEYLDLLKEEANGIKFVNGEVEDFQEDFEDLEEDPLSGSVLDDVNIYDVFQKVFNEIQLSDPLKHQTIFGSLSPEQHAHITHLLTL